MKKFWFGFAVFFLAHSLVYGYTVNTQHASAFEQAETFAVSTEESHGLTPKRLQPPPVTQHILVPMPVPQHHNPPTPPPAEFPTATVALRTDTPTFQQEPVSNGGFDPYLYAEMERLSSAVQQLQKETAKPDPKKSFSTPKWSGRLFFDSFAISQPDRCRETNFQNKVGLRELRLGISGTGYEAYDYKAEISLADSGQVNFNDVWIGAKNVPGFGYLRVGHYTLETGIGYAVGTIQTTGLDFLPPVSTFTLSRKFGISSDHLFAKDRIRWFYGIFQGRSINNSRSITSDEQGYIFNTRLTMALHYAEGGRQLLHFGGHYAHVAVPRQTMSVAMGGQSALGTHPNPYTLRTRTIPGKHNNRCGLELAYQSGPFGAISEAFFSHFGYGAESARKATGASLELSYFLTGDHRSYNLATGAFGAVNVIRPFVPFQSGGLNLVNGTGAWQVFTQYSYVDFGDWREGETAGERYGGYQHDLAFGVNWFWTSNLRWIFEYIHSQQNTGADRKHCYQDIIGTSVRINW